MAKIISTPKSVLATWKARVTCGNPLCRATLEIRAGDLYRASRGRAFFGGDAAEPYQDYQIASTCPACHHQWFLPDPDVSKIPPAICRSLKSKPTAG
jgi:hypothetical protein